VRPYLSVAFFGVTLGVVITAAGFTDWGEVHRMFSLGVGVGGLTLANLRLVFALLGAFALSVVGFQAFARHDAIPAKPIRSGTVPGAILFGVGWAISGACPAGALAQIGEGKAVALVTLGGMLAGARLHDALRKRLGWARHSCID
jgi:uncharacterized membrane protein YedE/YeeE